MVWRKRERASAKASQPSGCCAATAPSDLTLSHSPFLGWRRAATSGKGGSGSRTHSRCCWPGHGERAPLLGDEGQPDPGPCLQLRAALADADFPWTSAWLFQTALLSAGRPQGWPRRSLHLSSDRFNEKRGADADALRKEPSSLGYIALQTPALCSQAQGD